MSRNLSANADLAGKYAVGEIADFVGVADFYDAGTSKWMKSNTWVAAASVPAAVKTSLKSSATGSALCDNSILSADGTEITLNTITPPAVSASAMVVPLSSATLGTGVGAVVINADGARRVQIGAQQTTLSLSYGGCHAITYDGAKFWSFVPVTGGASFGAYSSTDGITWTSESLSGQPTFNNADMLYFMPSHNSGTATAYLNGLGGRFFTTGSYGQIALYCGARHLLIGKNASNYVLASRSSNGTSWGGDESSTVMGSTTLGAVATCWFYRNGNTVSLQISSADRYSSDGGVTWGAQTNPPSTTMFRRINASDATRICASENSSTTMKFSADSGVTWTTRTAPLSLVSSQMMIYGRGSSWVLSTFNGTFYKTTDDGATWSTLSAPVGLGTASCVFADANRWYMLSTAGNQIATSTDLTTWTVRNISNTNASPPTTATGLAASGISSIGDSIILPCTVYGSLVSSDGGVTWAWMMTSGSSTLTGASCTNYIANTAGSNYFIGGRTASTSDKTGVAVISGADVASGGQYFRAGSATVASLRTNASAYARVA